MKWISLALLLSIPVIASSQVVIPFKPALRKAGVDKALELAAQRDTSKKDKVDNAKRQMYGVLEQSNNQRKNWDALDTTLTNSFGVTEKVADTIAQQVPEGDELLYRGGIGMQSTGSLKTNIQAYKFLISPKTFNVAMFITLSPEVQLYNGVEDEKEKAKRVLNTTGGSVGILLKKYYRGWGNEDASFRLNWFASVNYISNKDSSNVDNKPDAAFLAGLGFNAQFAVVGQSSGNVFIEAHIVHMLALGESFPRVFGPQARENFWGVAAFLQLNIAEFIDAKLEYYRGFKSHIPTLDDGVVVFSMNLGTSFE